MQWCTSPYWNSGMTIPKPKRSNHASLPRSVMSRPCSLARAQPRSAGGGNPSRGNTKTLCWVGCTSPKSGCISQGRPPENPEGRLPSFGFRSRHQKGWLRSSLSDTSFLAWPRQSCEVGGLTFWGELGQAKRKTSSSTANKSKTCPIQTSKTQTSGQLACP